MNRAARRLALASLLLALACVGPALARTGPARQVTLFGVVAVPGGKTTDPKLSKVGPQLRKILPGHGFKLLDVQSRSREVGQALSCDLGPGTVARATVTNALNDEGKVQIRVTLDQEGAPRSITDVATPPNQLFFCDKPLPDGSRLVIGVGAR